MSLIINTNTDALLAHNNLVNTDNSLSQSMEDLSSGLRINTASDDAAGYAITESLTGQVNGLNQASMNAQNAVSMAQTAQGTMNDVEQMLQRIRELAVEYGNGTNNVTDQNALQSEVTQLTAEISRVGATAQFNGIALFSSGTGATGMATISFQVGANDGDIITVTTVAMASMVGGISGLEAAGGGVGISLGSGGVLTTGILSTIDSYISNVASQASEYGAVQNRLSYTLDNLSTYSENLSAAQSSIQDVDMASEETEFTKNQILEQAGISMLAQANQSPQMVLKLLG
ncbi:MAG: flagellin [Solirubrobacteraceae bacterium]